MRPSSMNGPMDSAWSMKGHDVTHTCRSQYSTENNTGVEIWRVCGDDEGEVEGSAVIDNNGIIYFGTMGSDSALYALYPNGTNMWRYDADGIIWSTPAIADDGTLYFTTWTPYHYFYALTSNGTEKWLFAPQGSSTSSPSIGEDGTIYFGDDDHIIYALNTNGTEKWRYQTGDIVMGSPAIGDDGTIYIGSLDRYLYALYPNGTLRWRYNTGSYIKGDISIGDDGTIYVPAFNDYFYALYPNGTLKWKAYTGDSVAAAGVALADDGTIYVGTELLRAYYPNGTLKWSINVQGDIYGTVPAVSADGTIYVSAGLDIVAVNSDGIECWRHTIADTGAFSSPSIGADGTVYVGSYWGGAWSYGYLHAFGAMENNHPPKKPVIDGPSQLKIKTVVTFTFQASDPNNNPISFYISWGDGTSNETMDYMSGMAVSFNHTWATKGTYTIQAKTIDTFGLESDWATFVVKAPLSYEPPHFRILEWLLERFPNAFPILRYFLAI